MLTLNQICKKYGSTVILSDISFSIFEKEIIGILGVNGAGKSTLANIITGLCAKTSGDIMYLSSSIYADIYSFKKLVGYCPQKPNLRSHQTLFDNLYYSGLGYGISSVQVIKNIDYVVNMLEISEYLYQYENILSGGYKQRFMIARSLVHMPKILILDEPTVGMDPAMRISLWSFIKQLKNNGMTIILTTHYLDEAERLCDRVCFLNQGSVECIDTPENLLRLTKKDNLESVWLELAKHNNERRF